MTAIVDDDLYGTRAEIIFLLRGFEHRHDMDVLHLELVAKENQSLSAWNRRMVSIMTPEQLKRLYATPKEN